MGFTIDRVADGMDRTVAKSHIETGGMRTAKIAAARRCVAAGVLRWRVIGIPRRRTAVGIAHRAGIVVLLANVHIPVVAAVVAGQVIIGVDVFLADQIRVRRSVANHGHSGFATHKHDARHAGRVGPGVRTGITVGKIAWRRPNNRRGHISQIGSVIASGLHGHVGPIDILRSLVTDAKRLRRPSRGTVESRQGRLDALGVSGFPRDIGGGAYAKIVQCALFDVGQNAVNPSARLCFAETVVGVANPVVAPAARWKEPLQVFVIETAQCKLLQVVGAL